MRVNLAEGRFMSVKKSQREATYEAITSVLGEKGVKFQAGMNVSPLVTRDMRQAITNRLVVGFQQGQIQLDTEFDTEPKLRTYVSGLISNWIRKDDRLNGNTKYVPNPGSRNGAADPQLKALKALMARASTPAEKAEIETFIVQRKAEITAAKAPQVDFSALPPALKMKYQNQANH
jgi:hypothetical protein